MAVPLCQEEGKGVCDTRINITSNHRHFCGMSLSVSLCLECGSDIHGMATMGLEQCKADAHSGTPLCCFKTRLGQWLPENTVCQFRNARLWSAGPS